ncbi:hypothetical protein ACTQV6_04285 [Holdemanella porci]|uniref:hypothetical protein n=1 Tax=Holdemanella porci TaxID=2652276 RepID=UPI003F8DCED0
MITKQEYIEALERMKESYYNLDGCMSAMNKFKEDINLLIELVNEHFKENIETNFEHYKDGILDCCINNLAVVKGIPKSCSKTDCNDCDFLTIQKDCHEIAKEWLKQPYKKLTYKLTKFEFDLIQTYRNCHESCKLSEFKQLIELKDKGYFKNVDKNELIKDILANCEVIK